MTQLPFPGTDASVEAAEYALHLMSPETRREFETRLAVSGALRAELAFWEEALAALASGVDPVTPPEALRGRIEKRLFGRGKGRRWSLASLLGGALGGGLVAAAAVVMAILVLPQVRLGLPDAPVPGGGPVIAPSYIAELASEDGTMRIFARVAADGDRLQVERLSGTAGEDRALELWLIVESAPGPVSLGVLPAATQAVLAIPETLRGALPGALIAVSDEPAGGSPTGAPTGPVLAAGALEAI